ncbi:uncharacterized protein LOC121737693 [Aricia agestis]|uniref:uncharacterized protein LOC121737693 n=1 Tax=Aricia agestis TaxID=91739 RepID=UPI001C2063F2|nr:uncharacterized protein LOC121737693 [Aricia agestis]
MQSSNSENHSRKTCNFCFSSSHRIHNCPELLKIQPSERKNAIYNLNLCVNCLHNHGTRKCLSELKCRECNKAHNTILHESYNSANTTPDAGSGPKYTATITKLPDQDLKSSDNNPAEILLATAIIKVQAADGSYHKMRVLLDQGSQTSIITEGAAQILKLPRKKCSGYISGVGNNENICKGMISIKCMSLINDFTFETDVFIMKRLVNNLPSSTFTKPDWSTLNQITLADPEFYKSRPVDILFGADVYSLLLLDGICRPQGTLPMAQQTQLGWILSGSCKTFQCNVILNNISEIHRPSIQIEDIQDLSSISEEHQKCINDIKSSTSGREDGSYVVKLPLKDNFQENLGESKTKAIAQFFQIENKLIRKPDLAHDYKLFMSEYIELGHTTPVAADADITPGCYLSHHCVLHDDSQSTKLRVVFNALAATTPGLCLKDLMHRGPNIQQDLLSLILKWRQFNYALTSDVEKTFRNIRPYLDHQNLQKVILWRSHRSQPLQEYQLATLAYGTKAAPFLAVMTHKQLSSDEQPNYPAGCASRSLAAAQLAEHSLLWEGPSWIPSFDPENYPVVVSYDTTKDLRKKELVNIATTNFNTSIIKQLLNKFSNLRTVIRVIAYGYKFIDIYLHRKNNVTYLTSQDLKCATNMLIKQVQQYSCCSSKETSHLQNGESLKYNKGQISNLNPIFDADGILRVSGRLKHSHLNPDIKHPIIIPHQSKLEDLIIDGKRATKKRLKMCVKCRKNEPILKNQLMGDLPPSRINPSRPDKELKEEKSSKKKSNRISFSKIALSLTLFLMSLTTSAQASYNFTPVNNSIYFDKISNMHIIRDDWRLIVYYDIYPYKEGMSALQKYINYLETICIEIKHKTPCEDITLQLGHELEELKHYNNIIMMNESFVIGNAHKRRRRGLIDGVGYVANSLFGVLDQRFADKYEKDIDLMRKNDKHLFDLWKNQTSVVEAEFNLMKRMESTMRAHHKSINQKINEVRMAYVNLQLYVQNMSFVTDFLTSSITATNLMFSLRKIQDSILDTVTNIYNGKLDFHLISPSQLRNELSVISAQIPKDLAIPVDNLHLKDLYNLLQVRAKYSSKYLIIEIRIPLIERDVYELFNLIPVPRSLNNVMINVQIISEFAAINLKKDSYVTISENDLQSCIRRNPEMILCHIRNPIYHLKDDHNLCETIPNTRTCKTVRNHCKNVWKELKSINRYFYFCCNECNLKILCEGQGAATKLTNAGLLNIGEDCMIKTEDFLINPTKLLSSTMMTGARIDAPEIPSINHMLNISLTDLPAEIDPNNNSEILRQFDSVEKSIDALKKSEPYLLL